MKWWSSLAGIEDHISYVHIWPGFLHLFTSRLHTLESFSPFPSVSCPFPPTCLIFSSQPRVSTCFGRPYWIAPPLHTITLLHKLHSTPQFFHYITYTYSAHTAYVLNILLGESIFESRSNLSLNVSRWEENNRQILYQLNLFY